MKKHVLSLFAGLACCGVFGIELTSANYVSNGLVGHWDGLENAGRGLHDATTNYWVDLSGVAGDFQIQTGVAGFVADGLQKTATGFMASNGVSRTDVRTIEVVVSGIPETGWVNALILRRAQTVTFNDGVNGSGGKRTFFFDNNHYGCATDEKPEQVTVCVCYDMNPECQATTFVQNGVKPEGTSSPNYWTDPNPSGMYIGGRAGMPNNGDATTKGYTIHAIRLYNRKITMAEANYNAALDRVRFFGASADDLPYDFSDGEPKNRMSAVADVGGGVLLGWVTDDSIGEPRADTEWFPLNQSGTRIFRAAPLPGWRFVGWEGTYADMVTPSDEPTVLMMLMQRPVEVRARFEPIPGFGSYVTNGLVCRLDGFENAGAGLHDGSTNVWKDLAETAGDFYVKPDVASFKGAALHKNAKGVMATNAVRRTDVLAMETVISDIRNANGWVNAFFIDQNQTLSVNNNHNSSGQRMYFVDRNHLGWKTEDRPSPFTFAANYTRESNPVQSTALFVNGATPATGTAATETWGLYDAVGMSIGGRTGTTNAGYGDAQVTNYSVNATRLYSRPLTDGEAAFNAALDQVRFCRASTNALPYRLTEAGSVECVLCAWTVGLGGQVAIVGVDEPGVRVERAWRAFGTSDSATFTAKAAEGWKFLYWKGDVGTITSGTTNDCTVGVSTTRGVALEAVFTSTGKYAQEGLIGCWDAIENAGFGCHETMPRVWKDLSGRTGDFQMNPFPGDFSETALLRVRAGRSAKLKRRNSIRTIEAVVSGLQHYNKWVVPVFVSLDQHLSFRDTSATGVRQFFLDYSKTGVATTEMPTNMTLTVTFRTDAEKMSDKCYMNGVEVTGEPYSNYWNDSEDRTMVMGARSDTASEAQSFNYRIHAVRFYDRELTEAEIQRNAREDAIRFFGAPRKNGIMVIVR